MNPGTGLQMYFSEMPFKGHAPTKAGVSQHLKKWFCFYVYFYFFIVVLHSVLNKRCTVFPCSSETMWSTAVEESCLACIFPLSPPCTELRFLESQSFVL